MSGSRLYSRRIYDSYTEASQIQRTPDNEFPASKENTIFHSSAEDMVEIPDNSVHMMITSPPYNVGKEYDENLSLSQYRDFLITIWKETYRVLVDGGRAAVNVANIGRQPYIPLNAIIATDMIDNGFIMRGEIIWNKGASAGSSCAWGSWLSASNPVLRDIHEYILVFCKKYFQRMPSDISKSTISRDEFLDGTKSVWNIQAESAKRVGHPAPFPVALPQRLIEMYSYENDIVLDPFMGSGTTGLAAIHTNRKYVGYETEEKYVNLAYNRLSTLC